QGTGQRQAILAGQAEIDDRHVVGLLGEVPAGGDRVGRDLDGIASLLQVNFYCPRQRTVVVDHQKPLWPRLHYLRHAKTGSNSFAVTVNPSPRTIQLQYCGPVVPNRLQLVAACGTNTPTPGLFTT